MRHKGLTVEEGGLKQVSLRLVRSTEYLIEIVVNRGPMVTPVRTSDSHDPKPDALVPFAQSIDRTGNAK